MPRVQEDAAWAPVKEALITASKALASEYNFIIVENAGNDGALDYFGLKAPDTPAFVIHDQAGDAKFVSKNAGAEALLPWLEQFKVGTRQGLGRSRLGLGLSFRVSGCLL